MARRSKFKQVDVFTDVPYLGNPVAVVLDGEGLSETQMLRLAAWTNLSETTFVLPSTVATYRLRIFTPRAELPFAGHPTIGSAHALREAGLIPAEATSVVQECGAGLVPVALDRSGAVRVRVPAARLSPFAQSAELATLLGCRAVGASIVDVGPRWIVVALEDVEALRRLAPDLRALEQLSRATDTTGVTVYATTGDGVEVRSLRPDTASPRTPSAAAAMPPWAFTYVSRGKSDRSVTTTVRDRAQRWGAPERCGSTSARTTSPSEAPPSPSSTERSGWNDQERPLGPRPRSGRVHPARRRYLRESRNRW